MNALCAALLLGTLAAPAEEPPAEPEPPPVFQLELGTALPPPPPPPPAPLPEVRIPRLDIGGSFGLNNPGGVTGFEGDFRLLDSASLGLAAGSGAWGYRLTPQARLYPVGVARGLFLEAGWSLNFGSRLELRLPAGEKHLIDRLAVPVVNASLGYRWVIKGRGFVAARLGWGVVFRRTLYLLRSEGELDPLFTQAMRLSAPGGLILGVAGGFSVL